MHPFKHPTLGLLNAARIRERLGDFSGVIKQPSKYAARMAQAFTSTEASVRISNDQWEEIADLGSEPYLYTDGVGTISLMLADMIWDALCEGRKEGFRRNGKVRPSAVCAAFAFRELHSNLRFDIVQYQIRFLGMPRQGFLA